MPKVQISPENKIYDGDGYLLRVACVCVRDNSENEVCNLCIVASIICNICMYVLTVLTFHWIGQRLNAI